MICQMTTPAMISSNTLSRLRAIQSWRWSNIHPSMQEGPMLSTLWGDLWESESGHLRHCYNSILSRHPVEGLINWPQRSLYFVLDLRNLTGYRFEFKPRSMHWRLREPQRRSNSWFLIMDPFCPISYARISIVHWISLLRPADAVSSWFLWDLSRIFTSHLLHRLQRLYFNFARVPFRLPASSNSTKPILHDDPPAKKYWKVWWERMLDCLQMRDMFYYIRRCHSLFRDGEQFIFDRPPLTASWGWYLFSCKSVCYPLFYKPAS